jgi:hypothetical protein
MNQSGPQRAVRSRLASGGLHVMPAKYAVQSASTEAEVTRQVSDFLNYLQSCHVISLLPGELGTLSARSAADIYNCADNIQRAWTDHHSLTATAQFWMEEVSDIFETAVQRLDQLNVPRRSLGSAVAGKVAPGSSRL